MAKKSKGPSYVAYKREYLRQEQKMSRQGYTMAEGLLTKTQFKELYYVIKQDFQLEVMEGWRRNISNITRTIVKSQAYSGRSHKQAMKIYEFTRRTGQKGYSYAAIRRGDIDWTVLNEYRKELVDKGLTKKQVAHQIGVTFFGSPE